MKKKLDKIKVIFEDEYFLAVDKPSGLVVHSDSRTEEETLVDFLKEKYEWLENVGNPHTLDSGRYEKRWGIVNRLDRDTSGVILIAKDDKTFFDLQKQFQERSIKKEYVAEVHGKINIEKLLSEGKIIQTPGGMYKISEPISRHKKDPRVWVCGSGVGERNTKRDAETEFLILHRGESTTVQLFLLTGRTHQLRLHMRFIGHPIVGDKKYGIQGTANEHGTTQISELLENISPDNYKLEEESGLRLHAKSLEFTHPVSLHKIKIETAN